MENDSTRKSITSRTKMGHIAYRRTPIEKESPEEYGYQNINYMLSESSVPDAVFNDLEVNLKDIALCYTDHLGNPRLRESIAKEGDQIEQNDILVTTGAVGAIFIVNTSLLRSDDHAVLLHPNYVANVEIPRAIGCQVDYLRLLYEDKFRLDLGRLEDLIKPNTRLISLTYPQNPTGTVLTESELHEIISIIESKECFLLMDETYRDMTRKPPPLAASLSERAISVSSFSKAYGLPGIRIGWLINTNSSLMDMFLGAKELIFICNPVIDEEIAAHFYTTKKKQFLTDIKSHVDRNFHILKNWIGRSDFIEWIEPQGGCICFPRITDSEVDIDSFYNTLKEKYRTFVAPGRWFEVEKEFFRIGYGYPSKEGLEGGLQCITKAIEESR